MSIYAISDLHLSFDERVDKPMDVFGSRWNNHEERLKDNWISTIKNDDTVIIPGDLSWALAREEVYADLAWLHKLPGKKVIIKGNHDLWWSSITKLNALYEDITFLHNTVFMADNTAICGSRGWICPGSEGYSSADEKIYKRELLRLEASLKAALETGADEVIGMIHYPPTNDKLQPSGFTKLFEEYGVKLVVYGHLHGKDSHERCFKGNLNGVSYRLVSLDFLDAKPVLIKE